MCVCIVPGLYLKEPPQSGGKVLVMRKLFKVGDLSFLLGEKFLLVGYLQSRYQTRGVSHYGLAIYIKALWARHYQNWDCA